MGEPLGPHLWQFLGLISDHVFFNIQYFDVYGGIWSYKKLFETIWRYSTTKMMRKKMRYLPGPVEFQQSWKKQCRKSGPQKSRKKTMSKKWVHICLYTFIYLHVPLYTPEYLYIPSYTPIYIKISNIRKMRSDIRPKNCHKWGPKGSPMDRIWHAPSYHTPKGFFKPKVLFGGHKSA